MRKRFKITTLLMIAGVAGASVVMTTVPAAPAQAYNSTFLVLNSTRNDLELVYKLQPSEPGFEHRAPAVTPGSPTYLRPQQSHLFDPWWMLFAGDRNATVKYSIAATGETVTIVMTPQSDNNVSKPVSTCTVQRAGGQSPVNTCTVTGGTGSVTNTIEISARSATYTIVNKTGTTIYPWAKNAAGASVNPPADAYQFGNGATFTRTARTDSPAAIYNWMVGITPTKIFSTFSGNPLPERSSAGCITTTTKAAVPPNYVCFNDNPARPNTLLVTTLPNYGCRYAEAYWYVYVNPDSPAVIRTAVEQAIVELRVKTNLWFTTDLKEVLDRYGTLEEIKRHLITVGGVSGTMPAWKLGQTVWGADEPPCQASGTPTPPDVFVNLDTQQDLGATVMHELGHAVGLRHQDTVLSLLATDVSSPLNSYALTPYDIAAFNAMYPVRAIR